MAKRRTVSGTPHQKSPTGERKGAQRATKRDPTESPPAAGDVGTTPAKEPEPVRSIPGVMRAAGEREMFGATGQGIVWAIIDSGIDATHPQFQHHQTLVLEPPLRHRDLTVPELDDSSSEMEALIDLTGNGTHNAGIIAGELTASDALPLQAELAGNEGGEKSVVHAMLPAASGVAPRCKLVSLKVLDDRAQGRDSSVIAALSYVRQINEAAGYLRIHGVNVSLGFDYKVESFACGLSPICVEVNELVRSGVVVVAAAGNSGYGRQDTMGYLRATGVSISINDPGNAEYAITVGSTHGAAPQDYGVSYFSSKGPTADGRLKPDLVAPGERILSCAQAVRSTEPAVPRAPRAARYVESTGTSAATAFVSGVIAALLSARPELIGQPLVVKQLLAATADDLKRDRYMQGHGAVNLMRALAESAPGGRLTKTTMALTALEATPAPGGEGTSVLRPAAPSGPNTSGIAQPAQGKRFAVALSYPGERRDYVKKVVAELRLTLTRDMIFYDRFYEAELVAPNLDERLQRIYHDDSELIIIFISAEYESKDWCGLEWRAIRDIIKRKRDDDVMPLRFDDTNVPGLFSIDGYIDLRKRDPEYVADMILERLDVIRKKRAKRGA